LSTGAYLLKSFLERDNRFRIAGAANIQASGLTEVTRAEMLPVFGEDIGRNIFFVPLAERRRQLEQIPWIEHATVMRLLPDQIRVSIVERQPVAFVRQGDQVGLVDANGVLLSMPAAMMAQHHFSFPVLTGIAPQDSPAAAKTRMGLYQRLLAELDSNGKHLSEQISEIDLTDPEDARVLMSEQGGDVMAHMGEDHFLDRYLRYRAHIAEWRQQYPKLASVDLRYEQQAVLQMSPATEDQQASSQDVAATGPSPAKPSASKPALQTQANPDQPAKLVHAANTPQPKNSAANRTAKQSRTAARNKAKRAAQKRSARQVSQQRKPQPAIAAGQGQ
jgi:cell division protein FtsQ